MVFSDRDIRRKAAWTRLLVLSTLNILFGCDYSDPSSDSLPISNVVDLPPVIVKPGLRISHTVPVTNDTSSVIRFKTIEKSCSCTEASLEKSELQPGEQTDLKVAIDAGNKHDKLSVSCMLIAETDRRSYTVNQFVYHRLEFERNPPRINLGVLQPGEPHQFALRLFTHGAGSEEVPVASVETQHPGLNISMNEPQQVSQHDGQIKRREHVIHAELTPEPDPGSHQATVTARCSCDGRDYELQHFITWRIRSFYEVKPSRVFFGKVAAQGQPKTQSITIRRVDGKAFRIDRVAAEHPALSCTIENPSADQVEYSVDVTVDPTGLQGDFWSNIRLETNHPDQPEFTIPVSGLNGLVK